MAQEDRLKKQIDQLARVLARLLAKIIDAKTTQEITENIREADKELEENYPFKLSSFTVGDIAEFLTALKDNNIPAEQVSTIADIYYEYALKCKHKQEQYPLFEKALALYKETDKLSKTYSFERHKRMKEIEEQMS